MLPSPFPFRAALLVVPELYDLVMCRCRGGELAVVDHLDDGFGGLADECCATLLENGLQGPAFGFELGCEGGAFACEVPAEAGVFAFESSFEGEVAGAFGVGL